MPAGSTRSASGRATVVPWSDSHIATALFLVVGCAFLPCLFFEYGFTDDFAVFGPDRDVWNVDSLKFCAASGRPLYGLVLYLADLWTDSVASFAVLRAFGVVLVALLAVMLFRLMRSLAYGRLVSVAFAMLLLVAPSFQVHVSWAATCPYMFAYMLSVAAYWQLANVDPDRRPTRSIAGRRPRRVWASVAKAFALQAMAMMVHQSCAMMFVTLCAIGMTQLSGGPRATMVFVLRRLLLLGGTLVPEPANSRSLII